MREYSTDLKQYHFHPVIPATGHLPHEIDELVISRGKPVSGNPDSGSPIKPALAEAGVGDDKRELGMTENWLVIKLLNFNFQF